MIWRPKTKKLNLKVKRIHNLKSPKQKILLKWTQRSKNYWLDRAHLSHNFQLSHLLHPISCLPCWKSPLKRNVAASLRSITSRRHSWSRLWPSSGLLTKLSSMKSKTKKRSCYDKTNTASIHFSACSKCTRMNFKSTYGSNGNNKPCRNRSNLSNIT